MANRRDLVECFGYAPDDLSTAARSLWNVGGCPFTNKACVKINHDQTIVYGTCSVTSKYGDVVICPNRLYSENYSSLVRVAACAYPDVKLLMFDEYIKARGTERDCVVALGKNSGKEVQIDSSLSMDWVLARVIDGVLTNYTGIEVQSIDITGNYRDAWHAYKNLSGRRASSVIPSSAHGLNWANVHKRLIPQLIRKSVVYSRSKKVTNGMYFVLPEIVYKKFEDVVGSDIPLVDYVSAETLTVHTYELGGKVPHGDQRSLNPVRTIRFTLEEFSNRFVSGPNLPTGEELDLAVARVLGTT